MILLVNLAFSSGLDLNGKSKHWAIEINNLRTKRQSKFERWDTTEIIYYLCFDLDNTQDEKSDQPARTRSSYLNKLVAHTNLLFH
jgi:hypothetical protein